jgi:hypothetical protein
MAYRTEIDRALDEVVSDEGNRFQTIAVVRAQQKWPRLIACERNGMAGWTHTRTGPLSRTGRALVLPARQLRPSKRSSATQPRRKCIIPMCAC